MYVCLSVCVCVSLSLSLSIYIYIYIYIYVCVCLCVCVCARERKRERESVCSSVVRAFAHGAMGRRINPSWGVPIELFLVPASVHD